MNQKTIGFINYKGGVGKTTCCLNISKGLADAGKKILIIDLDGQANATSHFIEDVVEGVPELLKSPQRAGELLIKTKYKNIDLLPSNFRMEESLQLIKADDTVPGHLLIKKIIKNINTNYDFILLDCPPALNQLNSNVVIDSNQLIIPVVGDRMSLEGLSKTISYINSINENYDLEGNYKILHSRVNRTKYDAEFIKQMNSYNSYKSTIRFQAKPNIECSLNKTFIIDTETGVGNDFKELVEEILGEK